MAVETNDVASRDDLWNSATNEAVSAQAPNGARVQGWVAPRFRPVFDEFVRNFAARGELGASVAVTHKGVAVLEAWGGFSDTAASTHVRPWERDTLSITFSSTKGATAMCAHLLAARGQLDLDARVSRYWPEFAANGKKDVTVRMLLDHTAGIPVLRAPVPRGAWADWHYMAGRLAAEAPWWEPGSDHGYHPVTYGWLVGEVVRRVSGVSPGTFFDREIAQRLGIDFYVGTPKALHSRISPLEFSAEATEDRYTQAAADAASLQALVFNMGDFFASIDTPELYEAELPAINGVTNAQGLAAMYAVLANGGTSRGVQLFQPDYVQRIGMVQAASHLDRTLLLRTRFGLGYWNSTDNRDQQGKNLSFLIGPHAFGHPGFGGSFGFADPHANLSMGYVMNRMGVGIALNPRGQSLIDAAYGVLGYASNRYGAWL